MKSNVLNLYAVDTKKTVWNKGHGKIYFKTDSNAEIVVGKYDHALKVSEMLKNGDIDGAKEFCSGDLCKSGIQKRDTLAAAADKAETAVSELKDEIERLENQLETAKEKLPRLQKLAEEARQKADCEKERKEKLKAERERKNAEKERERNERQERRETAKAEKIDKSTDRTVKALENASNAERIDAIRKMMEKMGIDASQLAIGAKDA